MEIFYLIVLLLILLCLFYSLKCIYKLPIKLKILSIIITVSSMGKLIYYFITYFSNTILNIYKLKPLSLFHYIYVPLIAYLSIIVLTKENKIKDKTYIKILALPFILYFISLLIPSDVILTSDYIYSIRYSSLAFYQIGFYIGIIIFIIGIDSLYRKTEKRLYYLYLISAIFYMVDSIFYYFNISLFSENIISEVLFLFLFILSIKKIN